MLIGLGLFCLLGLVLILTVNQKITYTPENFTYRDLTSEIHLNSGGLDFYVSSWEDLNEKGAFKGAFTAGIKVLYEKVGFAFDIIKEILTASKLDDEKRLDRKSVV